MKKTSVSFMKIIFLEIIVGIFLVGCASKQIWIVDKTETGGTLGYFGYKEEQAKIAADKVVSCPEGSAIFEIAYSGRKRSKGAFGEVTAWDELTYQCKKADTIPPSQKLAESNLEKPATEENQQEPKEATKKTHLRLAAIGGVVTWSGTTTTYETTAGTYLGGGTTAGNSADYFGIELLWMPRPNYGFGLIAQKSKYSYESGGESDSHLSLLLLYKGDLRIGYTRLWFGPIAGLMVTSLGTKSFSQKGVTVSATTGSALSLAIGAKVGLDIPIGGLWFSGIEIGTLYSSYSMSGTMTTSSGSLGGNADFSRRWFQFGLRVGTIL